MKLTVHVDDDRGFALCDTLLARFKAEPKMFPYDQPRAIIPQNLIPDEIRDKENPESILLFYCYICLYMRGGIESAQAFRAMIKLRLEHPELFDPLYAQHLTVAELQPIIKAYVGWDSKNVARFWIENSRRLMRHFDGKIANLLKGMDSWEEAQRRIWNGDHNEKRKTLGKDYTTGIYLGFIGFRPKMVAMFVYFVDWEGLLPKRFPYPTPADFHNFRLILAHRVITIDPQPLRLWNHELISAPWRDFTLRYQVARRADPVELADAIWLFSLTACGNSPLTDWHEREDHTGSGLFTSEGLPHATAPDFRAPGVRQRLLKTCLVCPIIRTCKLAIPAGPYYQRREGRDEAFGGQLYLLERYLIEDHIQPMLLDYLPRTSSDDETVDLQQANLF